MNYKFTVIITKETNWFVAKCIENNVASQGKTIEESVENLKEAVSLYYEEEPPLLHEQTYITSMELAL